MSKFDDLFIGGLMVLVMVFLGLSYIERGTPFRQNIGVMHAPTETALTTSRERGC